MTGSTRDEPKYKDIKWTIFPDDWFKNAWDIVLLLFLLYTCFVTSYVIAFVDTQDPF